MYKTDVLRHFKKTSIVARRLGLSHVAVVRWKEIIPKLRAMELSELTNGALKYDASLYKKDTSRRQGKLNHENQTRAHP